MSAARKPAWRKFIDSLIGRGYGTEGQLAFAICQSRSSVDDNRQYGVTGADAPTVG